MTPYNLRKQASNLVLAIAIATGSAVAIGALLPTEAHAQRKKKKDKKEESASKAQYSKEFIEAYRLRYLVTRYSNYVMYPIRLVEIDEQGEEKKEEGESKQLNAGTAIWSRSAKDVTEEDYKDF